MIRNARYLLETLLSTLWQPNSPARPLSIQAEAVAAHIFYRGPAITRNQHAV